MNKLDTLGNALLKLLEPLKETLYETYKEMVYIGGDEGEQEDE